MTQRVDGGGTPALAVGNADSPNDPTDLGIVTRQINLSASDAPDAALKIPRWLLLPTRKHEPFVAVLDFGVRSDRPSSQGGYENIRHKRGAPFLEPASS